MRTTSVRAELRPKSYIKMTLRVISLSCLLATGIWAAAPAISGISPDPIDAGGPYFLLTIRGIGFVPSAVARLGATPLDTTYVSNTELKAAITPALRTLSGHPAITVATPAGVSNAQPLHISPVLSSVAPSSVLAGSPAITLTLNGIGFTANSLVLWDAPPNPATLTPALVNSGKLTVVIPANLLAISASARIQVAEPANDIYSVVVPFDVLGIPTIASLSPNPVDAGGVFFSLTVNGNGFVPSSVVNLGGVALDTTYLGATQLLGAVPPELRALAGTYPITVTHPGVAASAAAFFTVSPVLFALEPRSTPGTGPATTITVTGAGFTRNSVVAFNGTTLTTTYHSSAVLSAVVPASALLIAGPATVQVVDSAGVGRSLPFVFTIIAIPTPTISVISPVSAFALSGPFTLTVTGAGCPEECNVHWAGVSVPTSHPTETTITAAVPASLLARPGQVSIQLVNQYGTASKQVVTFTVYPNAAVLTSLNPPSVTTGAAAFTLTITGSGFVPGSLTMWNDAALPTSYLSATQVIGFVPSDLLTLRAVINAAITVVNPGGAVSNALTFALDPPRPAILSLTPSNAPAGSEGLEVVVTGANFSINCVARWNGTAVTTTFIDTNHLKLAPTPDLLSTAGPIPITVTNPSGLVTTAATFGLFAAIPSVATLSPTSVAEGAAAFTLTVNGALFTPASVVLWNAAALATTYISASRLTAAVPANLTAGPIPITVTNPGGLVSGPASFVVAAAPPPPAAAAPTVSGVGNAFRGLPTLAPGALISIYGANLSLIEAQATSTPLPAALAGASVSIGRIDAPLLFVSPKQINAQLPFELAPGPVMLIVHHG
ncbi:MAG: IPT/TIG domain-containing protein, partial [Candidatus Solibacter sp.]